MKIFKIEIYEHDLEDGSFYYTLCVDGKFYKRYHEGKEQIFKLKKINEIYDLINITIKELHLLNRTIDKVKVNIHHHKVSQTNLVLSYQDNS